MAHMQPQITEKQRGWKIETRDAGTCYVPGDVVAIPLFLAINVPMLMEEPGVASPYPWARRYDAEIIAVLRARLQAYVEGRDWTSVEVIEGYFFRLSAPGYLDCTEWDCRSTIKAARDALKEMSE